MNDSERTEPEPHQTRDFVIGSGWVLVIVTPLLILALWLAIDHANANAQRTLRHANEQFKQAQILANRKFQQAVLISTQQSDYANNRRTCGWRAFVKPILKTYREAAKDPTLTPSARKRNAERIRQAEQFLDAQITIPTDFDCDTLPDEPPTALP